VIDLDGVGQVLELWPLKHRFSIKNMEKIVADNTVGLYGTKCTQTNCSEYEHVLGKHEISQEKKYNIR